MSRNAVPGARLVCALPVCALLVGAAAARAVASGSRQATATPGLSVLVQAPEPRLVAPTRRDRIGRIWAPVLINGKGPFRLVLDTGANHSAITAATAAQLAAAPPGPEAQLVGLTGTAVVPTVEVQSLEVGELLMGPTALPIVADVFGGAQGVLGAEGFADKRIFADFKHDRLVIARSRNQAAPAGYTVIPLRLLPQGLLAADALVGAVHTTAIIDTGAQQTIGNLALRDALQRQLARRAHEDVIGVTLDVQSADRLSAPTITFRLTNIRGVHVGYGDLYLFEHWDLTRRPVIVIGMDLLGSFEAMIIDYRTRQLELSSARMACELDCSGW